jgi:hypothetical protein
VVIENREDVHKEVDTLSPASVAELRSFIAYLRYKERHGSPWLKDLYDYFAPVREAAKDMSEEEINLVIDEAIAEARRERKP